MRRAVRFLAGLCALLLGTLTLPAASAAAGSGFLKQEGHLNTAYVEWEPVAEATGYQVFVKAADAADSAYVRLDEELVRQYPDHWRADALGLAAGRYVIKVQPVREGQALSALVTEPLTVLAHERTGYAFAKGSVPGAYRMDGTLKAGAKVIYVTEENVNTVTLGSYRGLQNIVNNVGKLGAPLDVRILGKVTGVGNHLLTISAKGAELTVEGVGNDATAYTWGFRVSGSQVEIANLAVMKVAGGDHDGISLEGAEHVWAHNCDFFYNQRQDDPEGDKEKGDGSIDTNRSKYITQSYNHFWDAGKCNLQGGNRSDTSDWVTYHHNWYERSDSRHPRVRVAHVHVYNNYYDHNDDYGIGACHNSTVFAENNYFLNCPLPMLIAGQGSDTGKFGSDNGGVLKGYGNVILGGTCVPYSQDKVEFDYYDAPSRDAEVPAAVTTKKGGNHYDNFDLSADFYAYTPDDAQDVPERVMAYAGRVEGGDFTFDMTTLTTGNKMPDTALMAALDSYQCALVRVGGNGGDTAGTDPGGDPDPAPTPTPGRSYTLTGDQVFAAMEAGQGPDSFRLGGSSSYPDSYATSSNATQTAGTDGFFTLLYGSGSRIDPAAKSFDDGWQGGHRINFNGGASAQRNAVRFQVDGPATVRVWWVGAVAAEELDQKSPRPMAILDSQGETLATSATVADNVTPMVSTFTLDSAGTYYLGGLGGKNFLYQVRVTVGAAIGELPYALDAAAGTLSVTGTVPAGETIWCVAWDEAGRFLGARPLTGQDPQAALPEGWARGKLLWLKDAALAPCCPGAAF